MPNLDNVLFFLILWHPLFHHKGKQNLLCGKDFHRSVQQSHLVFSHIFHDPIVLWSPVLSYIYNFHNYLRLVLVPLFFCFYPIFSTSFPMDFRFKPIMLSFFYTPFGLTCCIHLTHDLHSLLLFHTFYIYCFLGSYQSLLLCYWFL